MNAPAVSNVEPGFTQIMLNIEPGHQRSLVGARLLKAQFEKSAYGCKLYCCWCAQDLAANHFWEAMGFVPLAFRAGSRGRGKKGGRVHIFWQKRIRSGDVTTPYWFPSQTGAGALKEDRLVLPIPPGTRWNDAKPMVLPALSTVEGPEEEGGMQKAEGRKELAPSTGSGQAAKRERKLKEVRPATVGGFGGLRFGAAPVGGAGAVEKKARPEQRRRVKNDPKLVAAARELRDRWLEQVNASGGERLLVGNGKYDVSRQIQGGNVEEVPADGAVGGVRVKLIDVEQVKALAPREASLLTEAAALMALPA